MKLRTSKFLTKALGFTMASAMFIGVVLGSKNVAQASETTTVVSKTGSSGSYYVEQGGYFTITAAGGQGTPLSIYTGGKGRYLEGSYFIPAGSTITWEINYRGIGTYSSGGNAVVVKVNNVELMTAAGGGSAGYSSNGGDADAQGSGTSGSFYGTGHGSGGGGGHNGGVGFNGNMHQHTKACLQEAGFMWCAHGATHGGHYGPLANTTTSGVSVQTRLDEVAQTAAVNSDPTGTDSVTTNEANFITNPDGGIYYRDNTHTTDFGCISSSQNNRRVTVYGSFYSNQSAISADLITYKSANANATGTIQSHSYGVNQISNVTSISTYGAIIRNERCWFGKDWYYNCGQAGGLTGLQPGTGGTSYMRYDETPNWKYLASNNQAAATVTEDAYFQMTKTKLRFDVNVELDGQTYLQGLDDLRFNFIANDQTLYTGIKDFCNYVNYNDTIKVRNISMDTDKYKLLSTDADLTKKVTEDSELFIRLQTRNHSLNVNVYADEYLLTDGQYQYTRRLLNNKSTIGYDLDVKLGDTWYNDQNKISKSAIWNTAYEVKAGAIDGYTISYEVKQGSTVIGSGTDLTSALGITGNLNKNTVVDIVYKEKTYELYIDPLGGKLTNGSTTQTPVSALTSNGIRLVKNRNYLSDISSLAPTRYGYNIVGYTSYSPSVGNEVTFDNNNKAVNSTWFNNSIYRKSEPMLIGPVWARKSLILDINPDFNLYNPQRVASFNVKITYADSTPSATYNNIGDYYYPFGTFECTYDITKIKYVDGYKFSSFTLRDDSKAITESTQPIISETSTSVKFKHNIDGILYLSINTTPIKYTIEYYGNKPSGASSELSGSTASSTHTYDEAKALTANGFVLPGWTFDRWDTSPNGNGEHSYSDKEVVKNLTTKDGDVIKLYAQWKKNCYFVKYVKGLTNGGGTTARSEHYFDTDVTLNANGFTGRSYKITFDGNRPVIDGVPTIGTVKNLPSTLNGTLVFNKWRVRATYNSGDYSASLNLGPKNFERVNGKEATATALWKNKTVSWNNPTLVGYDFGGWLRSSDAKLVNENSKTITPDTTKFTEGYQAKWIPRDDTVYKVRHWKEKVNAASTVHNSTNYELYETETFTGTSDTYVTPAVKNYEGFTSPKAITTRIEADGSRVVDYYYDRWRMSLNIDAEYMKTHYDTSDNICTFDVYINGKRVVDDVTEYINDKIPWGSVWEIKDIKPVPGKHYSGTNVDTENVNITATYDD